jgi:hypothetical protein
MLHAAKEDWLDKFSAPVPDGELSETQMGPPIPAMIDAIGAVAGPAATELKRLHGTVKVMHSFVHGGVHLVVHALRGYPAGKLTSVLQNRNLLSLMLANVIVIVSQDSRPAGFGRTVVGPACGVHAAAPAVSLVEGPGRIGMASPGQPEPGPGPGRTRMPFAWHPVRPRPRSC